MAGEYIFTMQGLSKTYGAKSVFKDIHLSFYHGAKIGIVGGNGAGKSTLLGIMAGEIKEFEGEATVEADLFALLTAFKRMLDALEKDEAAAIRREKISLLDRIHWLLDKFKGTPRLSFTGLFEGVTSRSELIVTFLALLELVRLRAVGAVQTERFGEIEIRVLEDVDQIELNTERFLNA